MNRILQTAVAVSFVSTFAFAADVNAPVKNGSGKLGTVMLACPPGTQQVNTPAAVYCSIGGQRGPGKLNGPAIQLHANGVKAADGQYINGNREGRWVFFDDSGRKIGEIGFQKDDYHGRRAIFATDGKLLSEENWVEGKRQGPAMKYDPSGKATVTQFKDDVVVK